MESQEAFLPGKRFLPKCSGCCIIFVFISICVFPAPSAGVVTSVKLVIPKAVWTGDPVDMTCVITPDKLPKGDVLWNKIDADGTVDNMCWFATSEHDNSSGANTPTLSKRIEISSKPGEYKVTLNPTIPSDEAGYFCVVVQDNVANVLSDNKTVSLQVKQKHLTMTAGNGTYSDCDNFTTKVIDFNIDKYIEVNCTVTSLPKSTFEWTSIPEVEPGKAVQEVNETCGAKQPDRAIVCLSTIKVNIASLNQAVTKVKCRADIASTSLTQNSTACMNIVIEDYETAKKKVQTSVTNKPSGGGGGGGSDSNGDDDSGGGSSDSGVSSMNHSAVLCTTVFILTYCTFRW